MSPSRQADASAASDEKMEWLHFIGVGGKGLSAISILTHGRLLLGLPLVSLLTCAAWAAAAVWLMLLLSRDYRFGLLLGRHYRLWVCCWAVTISMAAGCYDYCCAFIAFGVLLFKFQRARSERLCVLSGGHSSCRAFSNMPDTYDLLLHFCLVCWWSHCILVPSREQGFPGSEDVYECNFYLPIWKAKNNLEVIQTVGTFSEMVGYALQVPKLDHPITWAYMKCAMQICSPFHDLALLYKVQLSSLHALKQKRVKKMGLPHAWIKNGCIAGSGRDKGDPI